MTKKELIEAIKDAPDDAILCFNYPDDQGGLVEDCNPTIDVTKEGSSDYKYDVINFYVR